MRQYLDEPQRFDEPQRRNVRQYLDEPQRFDFRQRGGLSQDIPKQPQPSGTTMQKIQQSTFLILSLLFSVPSFGDETGTNRTWSDSTGKYQIEAALVKRVGDQVHLKRADNGKVITISAKRLSTADQAYLKRALTKRASTKNSDSAKSTNNEKAFQVDEKLMFTGNWNNRKYGTSGALRCAAVVKNDKSWTAKFDGTGVYGKFNYDVVISTKESGKQIQLQGDSTVSGHRYKWSGSLKNGILFGKYTATNGNNGTFRLKQVTAK